jgi:hypothetical protein
MDRVEHARVPNLNVMLRKRSLIKTINDSIVLRTFRSNYFLNDNWPLKVVLRKELKSYCSPALKFFDT